MPCLEISLPKVSIQTKERLAAALTEAFCSATSHPSEIFGIRYLEYEMGQAAVGGKLVSDEITTPYIHFLLYCPRLRRNQKQKLASSLSQAFVSVVENKSWMPTIHICEHPYDNVVVGGQLLSDAYEECAKRKFYFELPQD